MTAPSPDKNPGPGTSPAMDGEMVPAAPLGRPSRAEVCVVACAEAWRGDGAILASPMGLIPTLGARLAQLTFAPGLLLTDGEAHLLAPGRRRAATAASPRAGCPTAPSSPWWPRAAAT